MNRTDRLFALLLELRGTGRDGGWTQAEDLAHTFGVSVRTIYRDVLALNESGVPVVSSPGKGYRLLDGYLLPSLHFTAQEAIMLMLGADAVRGAFDAEFASAAEQALKKIEAALTTDKRAEVSQLRQSLRVIPPDEGQDAELLRQLRGAVLGQRVVTFDYSKPNSAPGARQAFPLGLVYLYGAWMLGAFDPARNERRTFRLSRMDQVRVLSRTFERHPDWRLGPHNQERRDLTVRLHFAEHLRRSVRERPNYFQTSQADTGDGFELVLHVRSVRDVLAWVLSWGAGVRTLEPAELRELVQIEARQILQAL